VKKLIALGLALVCVLGLAGCNGLGQDAQEKLSAVYSFSGENDIFGVSNGVIVLDKDKDTFRGGNLEIIQNALFSNVASYSITFYTVRNGEKRIIGEEKVTFNTDIVANPNIDGNSIFETSGKDFLLGNEGESKIESLDDLKYNFWVELKVIDLDGMENNYQLQLTATEVEG